MLYIQVGEDIPNCFCYSVANSKDYGSIFGYICSFTVLFLLDSLKNLTILDTNQTHCTAAVSLGCFNDFGHGYSYRKNAEACSEVPGCDESCVISCPLQGLSLPCCVDLMPNNTWH